MQTPFFWRAHPLRALLETWALGVAILFLMSRALGVARAALFQNGTLLLCGACGLWAVLRTRLPTGKAWRQVAYEVGVALALSLTMAAGMRATTAVLGWSAVWTASNLGVAVSTLLLALTGVGYLGGRALVRLWRYWDRLRRRRMVLALTHAHLMLALAVMLAVVLLGTTLILLQRPPVQGTSPQPESGWAAILDRLFLTLTPLAAIYAVLVMGVLAVLFPPSALFSYWVAGLQADFNAMAERLQETLADLAQERDAVSQLLASRRQLIANVSHELRTPVATVRATLESVLGRQPEGLEPVLRRELEAIEREIERLQHLIDDLFALSRAEAGQLALELRSVDVVPVLQHMVDAVSRSWPSCRMSCPRRGLTPRAWNRSWPTCCATASATRRRAGSSP